MTSFITNYRNFCEQAEPNRAFWMAGLVAFQGNVLAPFSLLSMHLTEGNDLQVGLLALLFFAVLIPVLSAQPLRIILTSFLGSLSCQALLIFINLLT
jgi:hypothetical protein